ncbi:hypothetical protein [Geodermatophilus sabuli]|uniref:Uncharacterized protein n=1 Tax=Geodermatophilus sabuli TaxID=1564158 RepID=A0A285EC37_9ACTN|nr:hypothetical protein [Geodermatophilus sabuli]MBB3084177.1 hypothetical protein [Geodermatophilus sabuli]SNX96550.1 hypothetical protein SAMN06893097_104265 [Geodermatophilus sabuli]
MTTIPTAHDGDRHDGEPTDNRASRREADREADREAKRAAKRAKKTKSVDAAAATREAMRASLIAEGFDPVDVEAMLPPLATPKNAYTVQLAVADAVTAMRQDLPRSEKTWAPYLQLLVDGLLGMCPCPCPACAIGPCPCPGGDDGHADCCRMPDDELHTDCAERYTGVPDMSVKKVARSTLADAAWWAQRRGLKRTVARNVKHAQQGRPLLHSDGRGAREQFLQASRWMFTWLGDDDKVKANPATKLKLPPRQEAGARSLTEEEFLEVYGVAVSTGQDPTLDGLILRHLLIQAVRRGALLATACGGLDVEGCRISYWDQKKQTWRYRPTTPTHMADLLTHALTRGPRVAAPPDATPEERRHGIPALTDTSPVFYARPVDTFDADGNFVSREVHPITRKRREPVRPHPPQPALDRAHRAPLPRCQAHERADRAQGSRSAGRQAAPGPRRRQHHRPLPQGAARQAHPPRGVRCAHRGRRPQRTPVGDPALSRLPRLRRDVRRLAGAGRGRLPCRSGGRSGLGRVAGVARDRAALHGPGCRGGRGARANLEAFTRRLDYYQAGLDGKPHDPATVDALHAELDGILTADHTAWQHLRATTSATPGTADTTAISTPPPAPSQ